MIRVYTLTIAAKAVVSEICVEAVSALVALVPALLGATAHDLTPLSVRKMLGQLLEVSPKFSIRKVFGETASALPAVLPIFIDGLIRGHIGDSPSTDAG
jgi:hypothetical protein